MNINLDISDAVAVLSMDDGKKNAIDLDALDGIETALDEAEEKADAIVLAGRPGSFSAGFNISAMTGNDPEVIHSLGSGGGRIALRLFSQPKPLVAACTGHAFTIGALWLLACDTRVGERGDYKFGMTETALGKVLDDWTLELLKERLLKTEFLAAVAQSKIYDCKGALQAGFVDELVDEGLAVDVAIQRAMHLLSMPGDAYAANKIGPRKGALERMTADLGLENCS